ncbi:MAG: carboxylating nicotinate-nucleotide diphosphorylase [Candidatus Brocadiaceae bacterium]|nr:carboxylating nicotinate-nucleotide diphosphorylase [Candidatus Brocadiaceae bacterium]
MHKNFEPEKIETLVRLAIEEDVGRGDITTQYLIPDNVQAEGNLIAKDEGIIAGLPVVEYVYSRLDKNICCEKMVTDGDHVQPGKIIAAIKGRAKTLLIGERIALNFIQRLSGIATQTALFIGRIQPLRTSLMDTRKTTPGWRYLEKYAVIMGGGTNHRTGLYDQVLIKDNHLDIIGKNLYPDSSPASVIGKAVSLIRQKMKHTVLVEVETRTLDEVKGALKAGVDIILFDNMNITQLKEAITLVREWNYEEGVHRPLTEASGNITVENVRSIAETGVDRISVGAITHSAKALDISLKIYGY